MGRKKTPALLWQPRSTPAVREQLVRGLRDRFRYHMSEAQAAAQQLDGGGPVAESDFAEFYVYRAQRQRAGGGDLAAAEAAEQATLYWATAGQTRLAAAAARTLPEWSAGEAIPCPHGLMLFEEPIATVPRHHAEPNTPTVPVDGIMWSRQDSHLLAWWMSRSARHLSPEYRPFFGGHAVWPLNYFIVNIDDAGHAEVLDAGGQYARELLQVLGSLWLLIGQERVSTTTQVETPHSPNTDGAGTPGVPEAESVIVIDVHRAQPAASEAAPGREQPVYRHRWWVEGHWRQQACGPNHSERRPIFIPPHVKGPDGMPFKLEPERVYLLRDQPS